MKTLLLDIECYWDYFFVGMLRPEDMVRRGFEMSSRCPVEDKRQTVSRFLHQYQTVGYNSLGYDLPMLWLWIEGADNSTLKKASDRIITGGLKWWDVEDALGIRIPWKVKNQHIDLIEPQPNPFASLKLLNGRLHGKQMQDLPYDPTITPTPEQMDHLNHYCLQDDLDATHNLWNALKEPLDLRAKVGADLGKNVMSKSDTQMGLAIIKKRVEEVRGQRVGKANVKPGATFRYKAPDYIAFETPVLKSVLERIQSHDFVIDKNGKVDLPKWLKDEPIRLGESEYSMGIGGLHSTESNRAVRSTSTHKLCDWDVGAYYPQIILSLGLFPDATGPDFLKVYEGIRNDRIRAKRNKDKVTDKTMKIAINGSFGSLGSRFSFLYAPHLMISVTLTGQLALLMLIERAERAGVGVVNGNTDGIVMRIPNEFWDGLDGYRPRPSPLADLIETWERDTAFELEGTEYEAVYSQSVNSYFAIKPDGGHKRKGPLGNPWSDDPADNDVRAQLMKNPQMTICSDAALAKIKHGTPVDETIRNCRDMRQFVTVINAAGGATWRDGYLGKVVRYYWSTDGDPIFKAKGHAVTGNKPKVPKTDGAKECMRLPDEFPVDVDYARYIEETESILRDLGYYGDLVPPVKPVRITKKNREAVLHTWMTAI